MQALKGVETGISLRAVEANPPFFLVGFQRSGTTMLRMMLNAHPELAIPHDSGEFWAQLEVRATHEQPFLDGTRARAFMKSVSEAPRIGAWKTLLPDGLLYSEPVPKDFPALMRRFHAVYAIQHGKRIWGDKNTGTLTRLDELNALFPDAKFIHLVRDGRDCALSHLSKEYVYGYPNVLRVALEWQNQTLLCHKMGRLLPASRFLELKYEDLVMDPESHLRTICNFLGVDYSPQMLNYHEQVDRHVPEEKRGLWPLLDKPPMASNAYKWKKAMKVADRQVFDRNAAECLSVFGYEMPEKNPSGATLRELWYHLHERIAWRFRR